MAFLSREVSYTGRKEVFMGKAKFGIFGDGKELAQIAMAKVFQKGDWRSGYYRDQTFMFAIGETKIREFFAQLYAHTDVKLEPSSGGRMMNSHFGTRTLDDDGEWKNQKEMYNSASDVSCTAAQIPRLLGFAYASKLYRQNPALHGMSNFSVNGNEVAYGTIGNGSTSEGHFYEMINAAGVLQVPLVISVWDDEYGISVPNKYHTTKSSISKVLEGFRQNEDGAGIEIIAVEGHDYLGLMEAYQKADKLAREQHIPVLIHVYDLTQPQGHSTSGSHERYKSQERLNWEKEHDCLRKLREWILENEVATDHELDAIEEECSAFVKKERTAAWNDYLGDLKKDIDAGVSMIESAAEYSRHKAKLLSIARELREGLNNTKLNVTRAIKKSLRLIRNENSRSRDMMITWLNQNQELRDLEYSSKLYSDTKYSALNVEYKAPEYSAKSKMVDGREVVQACFDAALSRDPRIFAIGEDVGKIGDVNQGFAGLQEKHGEIRVTDTGIRESTIIGQGIGSALRGLRPIVEVQYLDYLIYTIQTLSDDLACLRYRTMGGQCAPLILRTRGHRLEGIWHSGSPLGMIINAVRGIYVLVPRNMTQAAGMYNTMLESDDPAILIESLNAYRLKERLPENIAEFKIPIGVPEILREGSDVTVVTYGSMCRIVLEAATQLAEIGIQVEVIDAQTLLPFDRHHGIVHSIRKTNRLVVADEDVSGGASAYMLQKIVDGQDAYQYLDAAPVAISAKDHRPAYGSDGDYYSKPNVENLFDKIYDMMVEAEPEMFPPLYSGGL
ncbi:alpha-ketoacid dehydrogenase subunit alpha/beta [Reichenbachiella versicolor]|uniref:alpha-ketoacid dehydrogenase subunit alpha/beta n=1 Tax=Reichenbachiella versicolor TaxID=1821036 RepID=UPI000D6E4B66|nr:alpha-ketoacid dehydrogenase subunit alpha/beta [Reichenbachiella versicolor]